MSIVFQILAMAVVAAGQAWAIAGDHRASTTRKTPGAETESPTRQPWAAYGMLAASGGLFLISAQMAIAGPESAEEPGGVAGVTGLLLAIAGSFVFLYGLLDKYVIHRGQPAQAAPRVRRIMSAFVAGCVLLPLVGVLVPSRQQQQGPSAAEASRVTDREGLYSIEVPSEWQEDVQLLEQGYSIAVSDVGRNVHLAVLVEGKTDFVHPELRAYADILVSQLQQLLATPEMTPWNDTQINGLPALQCQARGALNGIRVAYLVTCVETSEHFCSIQLWTTHSEFERSRAELEEITSTFHYKER